MGKIYDYVCNSDRFVKTSSHNHWNLLSTEGIVIGYIWYKNILGGWRLLLYTDEQNEWERRGVIESVEKLKSFL